VPAPLLISVSSDESDALSDPTDEVLTVAIRGSGTAGHWVSGVVETRRPSVVTATLLTSKARFEDCHEQNAQKPQIMLTTIFTIYEYFKIKQLG
jgi:hypothetical protein